MPPLFRFMLVGIICAGLLGGCGRRGQLEPPPGAPKASPEAAGEGSAPRSSVAPKRVPITPPKRDLVIDAILE